MIKRLLPFFSSRRRRCPSCGAEVAQSAQTCLICNTELPSQARRKSSLAETVRLASTLGRGRACPSCGAPVARRAKKCLICGIDLPSVGHHRRKIASQAAPIAAPSGAEWICPACGVPVARTAKKCLMCGSSLDVKPPSSPGKAATELTSAAIEPSAPALRRRCPTCGAPVAGTATACLMCGTDLTEMVPSEPEPPRPIGAPLWRRLLHVAWTIVKLPLAFILALIILGGIGLLFINQPWKSVSGINVSPLSTPLITPLVTPMDTPTMLPATDTATPTDTPTSTFTPTPTLTVTPTDTPTPTATATSTPTPVPIITYTVQSGDTWIFIADRFRVDTVDLARFNDRSVDDILRVGEVLRIPPIGNGDLSMPESLEHIVQRGDRLERIAERYNVSVEAILIANGLSEDHILLVDEVLIIPRGTPTPPTPTPTNTGTPTTTPTPLPDTPTPWPDTPTPTSGYPAPILLTPPDGQVIASEDAVVLTWTSVGILADDEWYVVRLRLPGDAEQPDGIWTKTTSWRVSADVLPSGDTTEEPVSWQVIVMRLVETLADGSRKTEVRSPLSEMRTFYWR